MSGCKQARARSHVQVRVRVHLRSHVHVHVCVRVSVCVQVYAEVPVHKMSDQWFRVGRLSNHSPQVKRKAVMKVTYLHVSPTPTRLNIKLCGFV